MDLNGKMILVTGGAKRIGRAIVETLAAEGAVPIIHYGKSESEAVALHEELKGRGYRSFVLQGDLSLPDAGEILIEKLLSVTNGLLDGIVNSASEYHRATIDEVTGSDIVREMYIHLISPFEMIRALSKLDGACPKSAVNILDARIGKPDKEHEAYMFAKQSLANMTKNLALELAPKVRVNGVAPGAVLEETGASKDKLLRLAAFNPMQMTGTPEGVAQCVVFLFKNDFITGQTIYYDGGYSISR